MKWAKNMKKQLTAKQMVGKEMNRCLISLVIKSMEIKRVRQHLLFMRLVKAEPVDNIQC